jgi:adenine-specific DNA-methyltransferase
LLDNPQATLGAVPEVPWANRLIYGDNLLAMAALLAGDDNTPSLRGKVDLIYIDPPFDSKADYRTKVTLPGVEIEQKPTVIEQFAYSDTWSDGTASYLAMITPRLILMRELLADTGSIYVHLDWHVGHYVKLLMDEIFGKKYFRNEIVWHYSGWNKQLQTSFEKRHDTLYLYGKSDSQYFASFFEMWDSKEEYVKKRKQKVHIDFDGRDYVLSDAGNGERIKRYLDDVMQEGVVVDDVWHIDKLNNSASESVGYSTQKTKELLERVIKASCPQGGLIADFFGGSGTTAATAEDLGCNWITTDLGKPACMIMRKRLIDQEAKPFLYQAIGDYQVEAAKAHLGRDFRIGDLSQIVLSLYGALPLPPDVNPQRNLGQIAGIALGAGRGSKTLVLADSPNKLTGMATLKKAIAQRDNLMGGWDRVVVLGWNFEPSIGETITALNDSRLEVLVIPPDLMDRLKKKGGIDKLRGQVRFSSLQYLTIEPITRKASSNKAEESPTETLTVKLKNYVLLSPEAINLDDANRQALQQVANKEPLALIEYWAVDPDYDGKVFRSVWQDYRGNTANDADVLRVVTQAQVTVPAKASTRKVCVRVVDVFGFEAEVVSTVEAA